MLILISDISCPGGETPCNRNGQCNLSSGLCTCDYEHQGSDCSGKLIMAIFLTTYLAMNDYEFCQKCSF